MTIIVAQFLNFLIPLNDYLIILNIFLLLLYLIFFHKNFKINQKIDFKILLILLILSFANIFGSDFSDDLNHYHYSFISNADTSNFIWGQNLLHPLYGTSSSWLIEKSSAVPSNCTSLTRLLPKSLLDCVGRREGKSVYPIMVTP